MFHFILHLGIPMLSISLLLVTAVNVSMRSKKSAD